jgi:hypothetical protein
MHYLFIVTIQRLLNINNTSKQDIYLYIKFNFYIKYYIFIVQIF